MTNKTTDNLNHTDSCSLDTDWLDEVLDQYYAPIKMPEINRAGLKQAILQHEQQAIETGRLIELDLLEQALNDGRNLHKHKLDRLRDLTTQASKEQL